LEEVLGLLAAMNTHLIGGGMSELQLRRCVTSLAKVTSILAHCRAYVRF
jgi:hypothetical protein